MLKKKSINTKRPNIQRCNVIRFERQEDISRDFVGIYSLCVFETFVAERFEWVQITIKVEVNTGTQSIYERMLFLSFETVCILFFFFLAFAVDIMDV